MSFFEHTEAWFKGDGGGSTPVTTPDVQQPSEPEVNVPKAPPAPVGEVPPEYRPDGDNVIWIPGYWWWDEDGGEFICVSNFSTAMLDLPVESSDANDGLMFSAFTDRIPPRETRVYLLLSPKLKSDKRKQAKSPANDATEKTKEESGDKAEVPPKQKGKETEKKGSEKVEKKDGKNVG